MPQILVWKCPQTNQLFKDQAEYKKHLAKLARARRKVKHDNHIKRTFVEWLDHERTNVVLDVADIPQWLLDNQRIIMDAANLIPCGITIGSISLCLWSFSWARIWV